MPPIVSSNLTPPKSIATRKDHMPQTEQKMEALREALIDAIARMQVALDDVKLGRMPLASSLEADISEAIEALRVSREA